MSILKTWRPFKVIHERMARRTFLANRCNNLFLGVYDTWGEADLAARSFGLTGYDNSASAHLYDNRVRMDPHDYPSLYWLTRSLHEGMTGIFDVGGAIGIKFYAFREPLNAWSDLVWRVQDVPAMVANGRELARRRGDCAQLQFTEDFRDGDGMDVLFASGSLQYLPQTLGDLLGDFTRRPRRIVINTTPVHSQKDFFTVNSIGTAFCPYRVQTQASLVRGLTRLGYRLRESWTNPDKQMSIPLHPDLSLRNYSGYCLDRTS